MLTEAGQLMVDCENVSWYSPKICTASATGRPSSLSPPGERI